MSNEINQTEAAREAGYSNALDWFLAFGGVYDGADGAEAMIFSEGPLDEGAIDHIRPIIFETTGEELPNTIGEPCEVTSAHREIARRAWPTYVTALVGHGRELVIAARK